MTSPAQPPQENNTNMVATKSLNEGTPIKVSGGPLAGLAGFIVNPVAVADGQDNARKVLVNLEGDELYILPRMLDFDFSAPASAASVITQVAAAVSAEQVAAKVAHNVKHSQDDTTVITDPMDPALDRFRPDPKIVKEYVSRIVCKGENFKGYRDTDYLLHLRDMRDSNGYSPNIALVGDTQSGKTMLVNVLACLAAERDGLPKPYPVFTINGSSGVSNFDLYGMTTAVRENGEETLVWMEGVVPMAAACGGFLYLDEWNAVPPSQAVAIHPLLDDRRQFTNTQKAIPNGHGGFQPEVVKAHPNFWVLSTINPGYKGTQLVAEATSNRFRWIPWNYDPRTERKLVKSKGVIGFGNALRDLYAGHEITVPVGTSALIRFAQDAGHLGVEAAFSNFVGMFPPREQGVVKAVFESENFDTTIGKEYPNPTFQRTGEEDVVGVHEMEEVEPEEEDDPKVSDVDQAVEDALQSLLNATA